MAFPSERRKALQRILISLVRNSDWDSNELEELGCLDEENGDSVRLVEDMITALFRGELQ